MWNGPLGMMGGWDGWGWLWPFHFHHPTLFLGAYHHGGGHIRAVCNRLG